MEKWEILCGESVSELENYHASQGDFWGISRKFSRHIGYKKENLLYKDAKDLKDLAEQPGFLLYEENTDETVLLITNKGDLYYKGYYYTGNTDAFIEAFPLFMEQSVECENSLDKEEFSEYWNEIQWNE